MFSQSPFEHSLIDHSLVVTKKCLMMMTVVPITFLGVIKRVPLTTHEVLKRLYLTNFHLFKASFVFSIRVFYVVELYCCIFPKAWHLAV